jgi:intein-encoded DNA endonuclease-like protein
MRHNKKIIVRAIHMHNDGMSFADIKNHLEQYDNVKVSREAIRKWCGKYSIFLK